MELRNVIQKDLKKEKVRKASSELTVQSVGYKRGIGVHPVGRACFVQHEFGSFQFGAELSWGKRGGGGPTKNTSKMGQMRGVYVAQSICNPLPPPRASCLACKFAIKVNPYGLCIGGGCFSAPGRPSYLNSLGRIYRTSTPFFATFACL
jgi:hypothetical protein